MRSPAEVVVAVFLGVGLPSMAPPTVHSQASGYGASAVAASAPFRLVDNAVPVRAALNQFSSALEMRDLGRLEAAGVKPASVKLWQKFFRENPGATVTDQCPASELTISGDRAAWTCTETVTIIFEGKPLSFPHAIHFSFARNNGAWIVADRR